MAATTTVCVRLLSYRNALFRAADTHTACERYPLKIVLALSRDAAPPGTRPTVVEYESELHMQSASAIFLPADHIWQDTKLNVRAYVHALDNPDATSQPRYLYNQCGYVHIPLGTESGLSGRGRKGYDLMDPDHSTHSRLEMEISGAWTVETHDVRNLKDDMQRYVDMSRRLYNDVYPAIDPAIDRVLNLYYETGAFSVPGPCYVLFDLDLAPLRQEPLLVAALEGAIAQRGITRAQLQAGTQIDKVLELTVAWYARRFPYRLDYFWNADGVQVASDSYDRLAIVGSGDCEDMAQATLNFAEILQHGAFEDPALRFLQAYARQYVFFIALVYTRARPEPHMTCLAMTRAHFERYTRLRVPEAAPLAGGNVPKPLRPLFFMETTSKDYHSWEHSFGESYKYVVALFTGHFYRTGRADRYFVEFMPVSRDRNGKERHGVDGIDFEAAKGCYFYVRNDLPSRDTIQRALKNIVW